MAEELIRHLIMALMAAGSLNQCSWCHAELEQSRLLWAGAMAAVGSGSRF